MMINSISRTELNEYMCESDNMISSTDYLESSRFNPTDFTRSRKMPFKKLIQFMITRVKAGTQNALEIFFDKLGEDTYMTQQAFSEARLKIKDTAFSGLFYMTAALAYKGYYETWYGYRILAIDGSKLALPDVDLLGSIYGTLGSQFIVAHGSVIHML